VSTLRVIGRVTAGFVTLLLTAELLAGYSGRLGIEMVAMNGEDYYCNPGEQLYLRMNAGKFDEILLGINLDDLAYHKGKIAYSSYNCPADIGRTIHQAFASTCSRQLGHQHEGLAGRKVHL